LISLLIDMAEDGKCPIKLLNVSHVEFRADDKTGRQTDVIRTHDFHAA
jgi:hypothetical protein